METINLHTTPVLRTCLHYISAASISLEDAVDAYARHESMAGTFGDELTESEKFVLIRLHRKFPEYNSSNWLRYV